MRKVTLILVSLSVSAGVSHADVLRQLEVRTAAETDYDVAFVATARIATTDVRALASCLARQGHAIRKGADPQRVFAGARWPAHSLGVLDKCRVGDCKFDFPPAAVRRLQSGADRADKVKIYNELVHQLAWTKDKKHKRRRIAPYEVIKTERCADHVRFHWLLDGGQRAGDHIIWRRHAGGGPMRPTLTTMQIASWSKGQDECVGGTLIFADHYYGDVAEVLQLTPADGETLLRFYRRDRMIIFRSWLARRMRWKIRRGIRGRRLEILRNDLRRCGVK